MMSTELMMNCDESCWNIMNYDELRCMKMLWQLQQLQPGYTWFRHQAARRIAIWPRAGLDLELRGPTVTVHVIRRICHISIIFSLGTHPTWGTREAVTLTALHQSHLRPLRKLRASCTNGKGKPKRLGQWSNSVMPLCHKIGKVELYPPTNCFDPQISTVQPQFHQASKQVKPHKILLVPLSRRPDWVTSTPQWN